MFQHPLIFVGAIILLTITPGADMALVGRIGALDGEAAARRAIGGIILGLVVWAAATIAGLSALLAASRPAFDAFRIIGCAYLAILGVQALWAAWRGTARNEDAPAGVRRVSAPLRRGLLTNLSNPKIGIFYSTFVPQFVDPHHNAAVAMSILVLIQIAVGVTWLTLIGRIASRAGTRARPRVRRAVEAVTGTAFLGLGGLLLLDRG